MTTPTDKTDEPGGLDLSDEGLDVERWRSVVGYPRYFEDKAVEFRTVAQTLVEGARNLDPASVPYDDKAAHAMAEHVADCDRAAEMLEFAALVCEVIGLAKLIGPLAPPQDGKVNPDDLRFRDAGNVNFPWNLVFDLG